jgi:transcriptional regulator GlxA family with amidase domain
MKIGFIIYDGMTALDLIGLYDPLTRLKTMGFMPGLKWDICAQTTVVKDNTGLGLTPTNIRYSLKEYDMIIVPGGPGSRKLLEDADFIGWLKGAKSCRLKVSVCTGALLLGAAGFLKGKKATTHPSELDHLRRYCSSVVHERIVEDGDVITAGGVTSSIDLGLFLCEKLAGSDVKEQIRLQMDYRQA